MPSVVAPGRDLRLVCFDSTSVVLDVRDGSVSLLPEGATRVVEHLRTAEGRTTALSPSPDQGKTVLALLNAGILSPGNGPHQWARISRGTAQPPSWGTQESPAALAPIEPASLRWYALGAVALLVVVSAGLGRRGRGFTRTRHLVKPGRPGITDHVAAQEAARAVRGLGRLLPLRVACWEEAAATTIALRWAGYHSDFRHGVATDPVRLHAWIEVGGRPVAEEEDITDYTPFEEAHE